MHLYRHTCPHPYPPSSLSCDTLTIGLLAADGAVYRNASVPVVCILVLIANLSSQDILRIFLRKPLQAPTTPMLIVSTHAKEQRGPSARTHRSSLVVSSGNTSVHLSQRSRQIFFRTWTCLRHSFHSLSTCALCSADTRAPSSSLRSFAKRPRVSALSASNLETSCRSSEMGTFEHSMANSPRRLFSLALWAASSSCSCLIPSSMAARASGVTSSAGS